MNTILTIGIPTYNGGSTINSALGSIVSQLQDNVEIVVSDNASNDKTQQIVMSYLTRYPSIKYFRNDKNVGGEENTKLVFKRACGNFVWLLGDDDKIKRGGIKKVLDVLNENPTVAHIFVNLSIWNRDFSICTNENFLSIKNDMILNDKDEYLDLLGQNAAFTPTQVINRKLWLEIKNNIFDNTGWMSLFNLFYLLPGRSAYIVAEPFALFADGSLNCHQQGAFLNQIFALIRLFNYLPTLGYDGKICEKKIKIMLRNLPLAILSAKEHNLIVNKQLIGEAKNTFGKYLYFWFFCMPVLLTPRRILRQIHNIGRYFKKGVRSVKKKYR